MEFSKMNFQKKSIIQRILIPITFLLVSTAYGQFWKWNQAPVPWEDGNPREVWSENDYQNYYDSWTKAYLGRMADETDPQILRRQKAIMNGNKITAEIWNFGSISSPGNHTTDITWEGLGYGYEFGPFIAAEVELDSASHADAYYTVEDGDTTWYARMISDGLTSLGGGRSPDGTEFYGWDPLAFNDDFSVPYADPESDKLPTSNDLDRDGDGKPDSWPEGWYNSNLKDYVWPGALQQGASNSDLEVFYVMDDRTNKEFEYYPFVNGTDYTDDGLTLMADDSSRRGLGIEIESRYYQWANPLAEDIIFLIYKVTNKSKKDLNNVTFGMWGDPHIGGWSNWHDDLSFFDRDINMVYCWDEDGISDVSGRSPGYFGYKFLESPGQPLDGIDNDNDGMVDESQDNGIDDDGDWDPDKHDVGVDGLANTGDEGENDGMPTAGDPFDPRLPGEPNFEWTDLDESDMIGLTGFASPPFTSQNRISNDHYIWENHLQPGVFDSANATAAGDYIFIYSAGPMSLPAGEARRFSIALIVGQDFEDLTLNALTSQDIYEKNYQFAKPPSKPTVVAVPGDEKVTLYWDNKAEESVDPISLEKDFEGYVIYRSTDPSFLDQQTITDAYGSKFLFEPHRMATGAPARFDLINDYSGLSEIPFTGRGVSYNLGNNTGIVHSFVDSNKVVNGQTYYYAVVSYDHGDDSLMIAPSECPKTITLNPETNEVMTDLNTLQIVPRSPSAGYDPGHVSDAWIQHTAGTATGNIDIEILDPRMIEDGNEFRIYFDKSPTRVSIEDLKTIVDDLIIDKGRFVGLANENIVDSTFQLSSSDGNTVYQLDLDYELDAIAGRIMAIDSTFTYDTTYNEDSTEFTLDSTIYFGQLEDEGVYKVSYRYLPVSESQYFSMEETNPVFDGMKIYLQDEPLELDTTRMGWSAGSPNTLSYEVKPFNNIQSKKYAADYEVRWSNDIADSSVKSGDQHIKCNFQVWEVTEGMVPEQRAVILLELSATRDSLWTPGERIIILQDSSNQSASWEFNFFYPSSGDTTMPIGGDIFYISTTRPFSSEDEYTFTTVASAINSASATSSLENIVAVPNPYVVTNVLEPLDHQNPRDRGPRRMYFNHLPMECTIRVYTITGELVKTLNHNSSMDDGKMYWDLTTEDNFPIAFGVYIYHVDAGDIGEKVGRFAVIK